MIAADTVGQFLLTPLARLKKTVEGQLWIFFYKQQLLFTIKDQKIALYFDKLEMVSDGTWIFYTYSNSVLMEH